MHLAAHLVVVLMLLSSSSGQRYAERNVLPAPSPPDETSLYDDYNYDDYGDTDLYGFKEDETNVYKWNVDQYPHPINTPRFCNRLKPSHVCDPDIVLEREQADLLDDYIQRLYKETPCICESCKEDGSGGIVVGIALLKNLHHPYHMHHAKVIRSFTENLRTRWHLGACENDILIVVATTDRLSYTDVGSATSAYLTVHEAHRIFLENKAKFSASNFSEGLMDILQGYHRATRGMRKVGKEKGSDVNIMVVAGIIVGVVLFLGILLFLGFVVYRRFRSQKDTEVLKVRDRDDSTVSSSWSKKDIKVLFAPEKASPPVSSTKYEKCSIDEVDAIEEADAKNEEELDFTLAMPSDTSFRNQTQMTNVTCESDVLEKDLAEATEGLVKTFPSKNGYNVLVTDM